MIHGELLFANPPHFLVARSYVSQVAMIRVLVDQVEVPGLGITLGNRSAALSNAAMISSSYDANLLPQI